MNDTYKEHILVEEDIFAVLHNANCLRLPCKVVEDELILCVDGEDTLHYEITETTYMVPSQGISLWDKMKNILAAASKIPLEHQHIKIHDSWVVYYHDGVMNRIAGLEDFYSAHLTEEQAIEYLKLFQVALSRMYDNCVRSIANSIVNGDDEHLHGFIRFHGALCSYLTYMNTLEEDDDSGDLCRYDFNSSLFSAEEKEVAVMASILYKNKISSFL